MEELQSFYTFPSDKRVGAGRYHTGLVTERGSLYMLGSNEKGQLGIETWCSYTNCCPRRVPLPGFAVAVACGDTFTLVKTRVENIYAFGDRTVGGITNTPTVIFNGIEATAGAKHATLLTAAGRLHTFGEDNWGLIGHDHQGKRLFGRELNFPQPIATASAGGLYTAFITESGQLYSFNYDLDPLLDSKPLYAALPYRAIAVSTGGWSIAVLTENGRIYTFGQNDYGQLGTGDRLRRNTPTYIPLPELVKDISVGEMYIAAVTVSGKLYVFGLQLKPIHVPVPGTVKEVSVGFNHVVMLTEAGEVYGFGSNQNGQLGQINPGEHPTPVLIKSFKPSTGSRCTIQ